MTEQPQGPDLNLILTTLNVIADNVDRLEKRIETGFREISEAVHKDYVQLSGHMLDLSKQSTVNAQLIAAASQHMQTVTNGLMEHLNDHVHAAA